MPTSSLPPIQRSWARCQARSLDPACPPQKGPVNLAVWSHLQALARSSIEDLYQLSEHPGFAVVICDEQGTIIDLAGDSEIIDQAQQHGIRYGISLTEEVAGTNAVDLALREALPYQTGGDEHYCNWLQPFALAAAPIFSPDGKALGALAILTLAEAHHPYALGMVIAAAQALHSQLRAERLLNEANDQLSELYATLDTINEGLIFVGPNGEIRRLSRRVANILDINVRSAAGRPLSSVIAVPPVIATALHNLNTLDEQEVIWQTPNGAQAVICGVRPVWDRSRRYLGSVITLRPTESVRQLVQQVVGAQATFTFRDIIGQSESMRQALRQARLAAAGRGAVLLRGEAGVGKEIFAQAIHNASNRAGGPFVRISCAAIPRQLLDSELFGVEGTDRQPGRPGKLELAYGGVIYLEAIDALSFDQQTSLLRAIEMGRLIRSGGVRSVSIDVRMIVAGHDLEQLVQEGRFRADLYARLSAFIVDIPPLRQRGNDVILLANQMVQRLSEQLGRPVALDPDALAALRAYPWPGNVRELEVVLERMAQTSAKSVLTVNDLPPAIARHATPLTMADSPRLAEAQELSERDAIVRAIRTAGGRLGRAAALLGISRATLWRKMNRYHISRDDLTL
ncbi:sigma-54-dependent Fis family transcriptional regulator [Chloroflexus sp.]|uniref:sigma-54-dependent Fis family transcriptional regulator n=1 Tax=Chloroflexus sp. TaxID=1904827 RepID=UPI002ACEF69E|nr:sigma 54-interacting transcriptional regulator [Chloroflexus sp.]